MTWWCIYTYGNGVNPDATQWALSAQGDLPAAITRVKVEYVYDHQGRMVWKEVSRKDAKTQSWEVEKTASILWNGYNIVQALTHSQTHTLTNCYTWGLDLSGLLQGAGGVGGLLAEIKDGTPYFAAFDANGNVTEYIATNGMIEAHYEYSPFGEIVVQSGDMADSFTHLFSTKPWCALTGLSEYEFRKYGPGLERWMSRDAFEERGGLNLYGFVENGAIILHDYLGLYVLQFPFYWSKAKINGCVEAFVSLHTKVATALDAVTQMSETIATELPDSCPYKIPFLRNLIFAKTVLKGIAEGLASDDPIIIVDFVSSEKDGWTTRDGLYNRWIGLRDLTDTTTILHELSHMHGTEDPKKIKRGINKGDTQFPEGAYNAHDFEEFANNPDSAIRKIRLDLKIRYGSECCEEKK